MRPLRFPRRSLWLIVVILGVIFGLPVLPLLVSFVLVEPPLQRYYLLTYAESGETAKTPGATTPVSWLYKAAPGRQRALLTEHDTVFGQNGKLPVRLSQAAINDGWTGIEQSPQQRVNSAQLEQSLRRSFYNGDALSWVMAKPVLVCLLRLSVLIAAVVTIKRRWSTESRHEERHGRRTKGPEMVTATQWSSKLRPDGISFQLRWQNPKLNRCSGLLSRWASPTFRIRRNLEANHILLMGDSGSGKSSAIRQILRQIESRGESAVVYDPALEFAPEFHSPERGDLILNPLDTRCPYWSLGDEVISDASAMTIAAASMPEKENEKEFFTDAPRRVFAHLLKKKPQPRDILKWMSEPEWIDRLVTGTPIAAFLDPSAPAQRAGVMASLNMVADSLELLPEWDDAHGKTFSTTEWHEARTRWVFLSSLPAYREKILALHSVWLDLFILRMMGYCPNPTPVWFVLDELASLSKLPQLHTAVAENRKYGNPVVMGFQGRSQLENRYGRDAEAMLSQPATKVFFKTSEPRAAKWISDAIGEIEVERLKESRGMGLLQSKKSFAMEIATKPLVMASEIAGLEPLRGYIKQENLVLSAQFAYIKPRQKQPGFIERQLTISPRPVLVQPSPQPTVAATPIEPVKKPVKRQGIFPGASQQSAANDESSTWDESQWID